MFLRNSVRVRIRIVVGILSDDLLGESCSLSGCVLDVVSGALVVSDMLVSPFSAVVVMSEPLLSDSDWEIVEPAVLFFLQKA